ncbi:MAG: MFS transporter [Planctomycetia bacterium]|nr:MFS transporter [Planctomycetia bacterium]
MSVSSEIDVESVPPATGRPGAPVDSRRSVYGPEFWCAYVANTALMVAISLMYRYADFVLYLDGTEWTVGRIVGVGMIGSLVMRFFQGFGIDHFGPRKIWLGSMTLFVVSLLGHVWITSVDGPAIFLLRILYSTSVAGAFGASITSVSRSLPVARMAEVIGSLGTSGFIAMALGPQLGDYLCGHDTLTRGDLNTMFYVAAGLGALSLACAELATRGEARPRRRRRPPLVWLFRRYHPGSVMLLGVVMGISFVLPTTFLPAYTKELGIPRTGYFFIVYACTAFLARLATRRFPERVGVKPMIYLGLAAMVVSLLTYLPVRSESYLMLPGLFAGIAHAVLFPSVTAQGSSAFPNRYRGLGTTVMLAMLDIGTLIGAPLIGGLVQYSKTSHLPPYPTTFLVLGIGATAAGVIYAMSNRRAKTT